MKRGRPNKWKADSDHAIDQIIRKWTSATILEMETSNRLRAFIVKMLLSFIERGKLKATPEELRTILDYVFETPYGGRDAANAVGGLPVGPGPDASPNPGCRGREPGSPG